MLYGPKTASVEWSPKASPDITTVFSHDTTELLGLPKYVYCKAIQPKNIATQYNKQIAMERGTNGKRYLTYFINIKIY